MSRPQLRRSLRNKAPVPPPTAPAPVAPAPVAPAPLQTAPVLPFTGPENTSSTPPSTVLEPVAAGTKKTAQRSRRRVKLKRRKGQRGNETQPINRGDQANQVDQGDQAGPIDDPIVNSSDRQRAPLNTHNLRRLTQALFGPRSENQPGQRSKLSLPMYHEGSRVVPNFDYLSPQGSSFGTPAQYRLNSLSRARIFIHPRPPAEPVLSWVNSILQGKADANETSGLIGRVSATLCRRFADVLYSEADEDDCIKLLHDALRTLDVGNRLALPKRAIWLRELMPHIVNKTFDLGFLGDVSEPKVHTHIGTPRPDITVGIRESVIVSELAHLGVEKKETTAFLRYMQSATVERNEGGPKEPILMTEPTQCSMQIRFPFLIVHGSSYASGEPIYKVQNCAAVSAACALKIMRDLIDVAQRVQGGDLPDYEDEELGPPLVFLICTHGPIHELWVSYDVEEDGVRKSMMSIVKSCHMGVPETVDPFLKNVSQILRWGSGELLGGVASRLHTVCRHA